MSIEISEISALRYPLARDDKGQTLGVDARASHWIVYRGRDPHMLVAVAITATARQLADALASAGHDAAGDFSLLPVQLATGEPFGFPAFCRLVRSQEGTVFAVDP
jgi:hypothetical protein